MPEIIRNKDVLINWFNDEHELSTILGSQRCWLPVISIFGYFSVSVWKYIYNVDEYPDQDPLTSPLEQWGRRTAISQNRMEVIHPHVTSPWWSGLESHIAETREDALAAHQTALHSGADREICLKILE